MDKSKARIRASSLSLVQRRPSFIIYALSVLAFVGSVCEPDKETVTAENLALQRLSAGPLHALLAAWLRRRIPCGFKIDVDDIQLTSKAARFHVASHSEQLSPGMERIRAAEDHCDRTLDSFSVYWDEKYFRSSYLRFPVGQWHGQPPFLVRCNQVRPPCCGRAETSSTTPKQFANVPTASWASSANTVWTCSRSGSAVSPSRANLVLLSVLSASPATVCAPVPDSVLSTTVVVISWAMRNLTFYSTATVALLCFTISNHCGVAPANAFPPRLSLMTFFSRYRAGMNSVFLSQVARCVAYRQWRIPRNRREV